MAQTMGGHGYYVLFFVNVSNFCLIIQRSLFGKFWSNRQCIFIHAYHTPPANVATGICALDHSEVYHVLKCLWKCSWVIVLFCMKGTWDLSMHWQQDKCMLTQIARFMGPTWDPSGSCRPHVGPINLSLRGVPINGNSWQHGLEHGCIMLPLYTVQFLIYYDQSIIYVLLHYCQDMCNIILNCHAV